MAILADLPRSLGDVDSTPCPSIAGAREVRMLKHSLHLCACILHAVCRSMNDPRCRTGRTPSGMSVRQRSIVSPDVPGTSLPGVALRFAAAGPMASLVSGCLAARSPAKKTSNSESCRVESKVYFPPCRNHTSGIGDPDLSLKR